MPHALTQGLAATMLAAVLCGSVVRAEGDSIVEANVKLIEAGDVVQVSRIPDGVYLRTVNDPDDVIWERLPEYRASLISAPPVHDSVALRLDEDDPGRTVYFTVARTSDRFYVRLRWHDRSRDTATTLDRFRDGAAVQFAIGGEDTSYIMGTGPEEPVNIWYWRSDQDRVESLAAGGPGSTTRLEDQPVTGSGLYEADANQDANQWVVVMSRAIETAGDFQVPLNRAQVPMAFALWEGSEAQRDGLKSVSEDWILVDLSAN